MESPPVVTSVYHDCLDAVRDVLTPIDGYLKKPVDSLLFDDIATQMNRSTNIARAPAIKAVAVTWWAGSSRSLTRPNGTAVRRKATIPLPTSWALNPSRNGLSTSRLSPLLSWSTTRQRIHATNVAIAAVPNRRRGRDQG